jgi:hypothetical protein
MSSETMDQLAHDQKSVGDLINKICEKYNSEPVARRTKTYVSARLKEVQAYWKDFDERHEQMKALDEERIHLYFSQNYYDKIRNLVNRIQDELTKKHPQLENLLQNKPTAPGRSTTPRNTSEGSDIDFITQHINQASREVTTREVTAIKI